MQIYLKHQNNLREHDVFYILCFYFYVKWKKVQANQVGLKLNGTHRLLVYADDVNLLANNIVTIKKDMETLIDSSKEVGLEVNTKKIKYILCLVTRI
jgi:predicted nucleotidyltransferase